MSSKLFAFNVAQDVAYTPEEISGQYDPQQQVWVGATGSSLYTPTGKRVCVNTSMCLINAACPVESDCRYESDKDF